MKAACIDQQTVQLTDNERLIGEIVYKRIFSYDAEISVMGADRYEIKSRGFFGTSIVVTKNETTVANLSMNLKGQMVITMSNGEEFLFKDTGIFRNKFVIENKAAERVIQYEPTLNWSKFKYNYAIEQNLKAQDTLLTLLGIYASNYYIAAMSGLV